jgi:hypothetical protein
MLTKERLHELFNYSDGQLVSKLKIKRRNIGDTVCCKADRGYMTVCVDGKNYRAHRVIYLFHHGYLPEQIDHINGDRSDNRIENLRPATISQNGQNRKPTGKSGIKGVVWHKQIKRWVASISVNGKTKHLGCFETLEQAAEVSKAARIEMHKEYAWELRGEK